MILRVVKRYNNLSKRPGFYEIDRIEIQSKDAGFKLVQAVKRQRYLDYDIIDYDFVGYGGGKETIKL